MKPRTAIIFAAGIGTRMLPITAAIQKELLPIGTRPVIDYIVSDLVAAGITRIIFVVRPGQKGIKSYYQGNPSLEAQLKRLGKTAAISQLAAIHAQANFEFVDQPESAGYGTAIPLQAALPLLDPAETVMVCGGDDFVWRADGTSEMKDFIDSYIESGADGALMGLELHDEDRSQYGVLAYRTENSCEYLTDIIEKPSAGNAPSSLANVSKYILNGKICEAIKTVEPRPENAEFYIIDGIISASKSQKIVIHRIAGDYLDTGTPGNWLKANQIIAAATSQVIEK